MQDQQYFEPRISYAAEDDPVWKQMVIRLIETVTGQPAIERKYQALRRHPSFSPQTFWIEALNRLNVTLDYQLPEIPQEGPLVVIANHPFGIVDGLAICHLASQMRLNFQILTNSVLCQDPALDPYLLPVSFEETKEATLINIQTKQKALNTLAASGAVVVFPGGGISTAQGWRGPVTDLVWKRFTAKLIQQAKATVVPMYFHGHNSALFQFVSQFSLTLRLALLVHEAKRLKGSTIKITVGAPLDFESLSHLKNRQHLLDHLRQHVYSLALTSPKLLSS